MNIAKGYKYLSFSKAHTCVPILYESVLNNFNLNLSSFIMETVLITGGTGLIGQSLTHALLQQGYSVIILSRNTGTQETADNLSYANWDVAAQTIDRTAIQKADYIIHLAGANVAEGRWTKKRKQEIGNSRMQSGGCL